MEDKRSNRFSGSSVFLEEKRMKTNYIKIKLNWSWSI